MKRNWDIIREILVKLEDFSPSPEKSCLELSDFKSEDPLTISYHVELMLESGLINGEMHGEMVIVDGFFIERMTWEGHEFLDSIRSDSVWSKVKAEFSQNKVPMTFDLVKSVSTGITTSLFKSIIS